MEEIDLEILTHVDSSEFILSEVEVLEVAFAIATQATEQYDTMPHSMRGVVQENNLRVYSTVVALLENHDDRYWKQ